MAALRVPEIKPDTLYHAILTETLKPHIIFVNFVCRTVFLLLSRHQKGGMWERNFWAGILTFEEASRRSIFSSRFLSGSAATTEKKIPYFFQTFPNLKFHFFQTPTVANNTRKSQTVLNRPPQFFFFLRKRRCFFFFFFLSNKDTVCIFVFDLSCQEDQLVLLLPNKLPGSALDWLSRAKQPLALDASGGRKGEHEKKQTKGSR